MELEHLNEMEKIAAKRKGQVGDIDKTEEIQALESRIIEGATADQLKAEFLTTGLLELPTFEKMLDKYGSSITKEEGR